MDSAKKGSESSFLQNSSFCSEVFQPPADAKMSLARTAGDSVMMKKMWRAGPKTIQSLDHDILCLVFSFLNLFDLARCSVVCKSWNAVIVRYKLLQLLCHKLQQDSSTYSTPSTSQQSLEIDLELFAMKQHRSLLQEGQIDIDQWKGHSIRIDQCRLKMGLVLTGVGDKVWFMIFNASHAYGLPGAVPLVDFDFDESKIVGLVSNRICIWRRNGKKTIFPSQEGTFSKGLCMRYFDPEAVVGCEDGTACVFDMYSRKCSRIVRMHAWPLTCLALSEDQIIFSGSALGHITVADPSSDQLVVRLKSTESRGGIKTLCFNPSSHFVFAGTTAGYISCWDLRKRGVLWERRASPNVVYSLQHQRNDTSLLVAGGIDGVLRILNQSTGEVLSSCVMDDKNLQSSSRNEHVILERKKGRRVLGDFEIDRIPRSARPPITCLAVGMKKVVTTHGGKHISVWKFNNTETG
ncbi:F-box/WD-40 repeat-containing protein At3g52030 isoform X2 [Carica papaya]|uniref:F-box/WD-40 repeat-containing protein At3g52030 isoform X2 n=1 Tax=Carica papaya TaxID=3649 RepID=UPI000B8CB8DC|nr:F-box/WD-40 repeat-containing protein At3g52030 isoform X2 [Carica papaya]